MKIQFRIRNFTGIAVAVLAAILTTTAAFAQTKAPASGSAEGGSPAWFLVLNANPVANIKNSRTIHAVYVAGNLVR